MEIPAIFLTGLLAGGLTCLAVQGGLLASSVANQKSTALSVVSFLIARLAAYTVVGALLGAFGSVFRLSIATQVILQGAVAIFMIGTALNLLNVHPVFRYFVLQPPRALTKHVKNSSRSTSMFGPALLGAFTIFIPCGATQAMMAYAVSTGSVLSGAATMFAFILGTSPLFFVVGYAMKSLSVKGHEYFNKLAAAAIIIVALFILNNAYALYSAGNIVKKDSSTNIEVKRGGAVDPVPVDRATIYFTPTAYVTEPASIVVRAGSRVRLTLVNTEGVGCIQAFTIPSLGVQQVIPVGSTQDMVITIPDTPGELPFMCAMGMYRGSITIL